MSTLHIELDGGAAAAAVLPGRAVTGHIAWQLDEDRQWLELRLLWHTEGKGTRDGELVQTHRITSPATSGREPFSFTLPTGPYSFSGSLISVVWALELVGDDEQHAQRLELTLSPHGREIELREVEKAR